MQLHWAVYEYERNKLLYYIFLGKRRNGAQGQQMCQAMSDSDMSDIIWGFPTRHRNHEKCSKGKVQVESFGQFETVETGCFSYH